MKSPKKGVRLIHFKNSYHNDVDYWHKLDPKAAEWLRLYQRDIRGVPAADKPQVPKTRRQASLMNRENRLARNDSFTKSQRASLELSHRPATDWAGELPQSPLEEMLKVQERMEKERIIDEFLDVISEIRSKKN